MQLAGPMKISSMIKFRMCISSKGTLVEGGNVSKQGGHDTSSQREADFSLQRRNQWLAKWRKRSNTQKVLRVTSEILAEFS